MKKTGLLFLSTLFLVGGSILSVSNERPSPVLATKLPTVINVKDATVEEVRNYYSSIGNDKKGQGLLDALHEVIKDHTTFSADQDWNAFKIVNRDWEQSPLSEAQLKNYSASEDNPYVHILYRDDNGKPTAAHANDTHGQVIDREHVWPKAFGGFDYDAPAGSDLHHLMPGDSTNNQQGHNNNFYGNTGLEKPNIGTEEKHNLTGRKTSIKGKGGNDYFLYEPQDSDKGDIARACFYMAARYSVFTSATDPFLQLTDEITDFSSTTYAATPEKPGKLGLVSALLEWHHLDPVDDFEIHRNNLIFNNYQHNRNPFIDFPDWVDIAFNKVDRAADPSKDIVAEKGQQRQGIIISSTTQSATSQQSSSKDDRSGGDGINMSAATAVVVIIFVALMLVVWFIARSKKSKK